MKLAATRDLIKHIPAEEVIQKISPFLTENRKATIDTLVANRLQSIQVAVENPYDPRNAAAVVRSCDAFGVQTLHVIGEDTEKVYSKGVTQGASKWVDVQHYLALDEYICAMRSNNYLIAGACLGGELGLSSLPIDKPICLLFGNESNGLTEQAKQDCNLHYQIPMFGMSESFNLSVSAAISLYDVTQRKRQLLGKNGDLDLQASQAYQAVYYAMSIDYRMLENLFEL